MIKIAHVKEVDSLNNCLPQEVIQAVTEIASVLDDEYGEIEISMEVMVDIF